MRLKDKFDFHAHWRHFEKLRADAPETEIHAVISTAEKIDTWPAGVEHGTYLPHHNGTHHIYTISAKTGDFEKFCDRPVVLQISL